MIYSNHLSRFIVCAFLCALLTLVVGEIAFAQNQVQNQVQVPVQAQTQVVAPVSSPKRVGDWQIFCKEATSPAVKPAQNCRLVQSHAMDAEAKSIFMVSVMNDAARGGVFALVTVPLEIYLAPGIVLEGENKKPYKVLYEMCNTAGCHGGFKLTPEVLALFKGNKPIVARVWTTTNKALSVSLSPKGFDEALKTLSEPAK